MADEMLKKISEDDRIREQIRSYELAKHDIATDLYFAKEEGKEEEKYRIVRSALKKGLSKEIIMEITGLTKEELAVIEKNL